MGEAYVFSIFLAFFLMIGLLINRARETGSVLVCCDLIGMRWWGVCVCVMGGCKERGGLPDLWGDKYS